MNDTDRGVGYDPSDQTRFPYQKQDPPFSDADLVFDHVVIDDAPNLELHNFVFALYCKGRSNHASQYRTVDMALRLFVKSINRDDHAYADIAYADLFTACLDQASIWEDG